MNSETIAFENNEQLKRNSKLIAKARNQSGLKFRFPRALEKQYFQHFENLAKKSFKTSYLFMSIPILLIAHLGVMGITWLEFWNTLLEALISIVTFEPILKGTTGVYVLHFYTVAIVIILWPLHQKPFFQNNFQLKLSIATGVILSLMATILAMADDPRYIFSQQMELVATYLFVFVLLRMQLFYLFVNQCIAGVLLGIFAFSLNLQPNWAEFSALVIAMSGFGFIYAFLREIHERENFLDLVEIENQKLQFEFLHQQIEKENLLKAELSKFYAVMSGEKDLFKLGDKILSFLVKESNANIGTLFITQQEKLIRIAQHGTQNSEALRKTIKIGEGLVGQCALEKSSLFIDKSPEQFQIIQSGLGTITQPSLSILPILFDDELIGVIEMASIKPIEEHTITFLGAANRSIATALKAVSAKTDLSKL